jgi:hypothetical protein
VTRRSVELDVRTHARDGSHMAVAFCCDGSVHAFLARNAGGDPDLTDGPLCGKDVHVDRAAEEDDPACEGCDAPATAWLASAEDAP